MLNVKGLWLYDSEHLLRIEAEAKAERLTRKADELDMDLLALKQKAFSLESELSQLKADKQKAEEQLAREKQVNRFFYLREYGLVEIRQKKIVPEE